MKDVSLRDYQQQVKEQVFSQWDFVDNILYQMPTGTGKTRLFTSIECEYLIEKSNNSCIFQNKNVTLHAKACEDANARPLGIPKGDACYLRETRNEK